MSLELVSRCLDLDIEAVPTSSGKRKKKIGKGTNAVEHIKTNREGVWSELRRLEKKEKRNVFDKRKKRKLKSALEKYKEENAQDHTQANVDALLKLTELGKVKDQVAEKILFKQPCQLSRDLEEEVVEQEESTVFTEEDFRKFEKEYHPNPR